MEKHGEGRFRQQICKSLREAGLFVSTVEGGGMGGTPGIPDVYYSGRTTMTTNPMYMEGWLELKVLRGEDLAAKARTSDIPVVSGITHYTQQQRVWHTKHARGGGKVHVLVKAVWEEDPHYYMFEGGWAAEHLGRDLLMRDFCRWSVFDRNLLPCKFPTTYYLVRALLRLEPEPPV